MSVRVSLLRRAAFAAGLLGVATASHATYLGFIDTSTFLGGLDGGGHQRFWFGTIDIDGSNTSFDSTNVSGLGFYGWRQTVPIGTQYDARGHGYASKAANEFYTICGQFVGINSNQDFDAYTSNHFGDGGDGEGVASVTRGGKVALSGFSHAFASNNRLQAAGFQLAVWCAVYGGGGTGANATFGSTVSVGDGGGSPFTAKLVTGIATDWYNAGGATDSIVEWAEFYYNNGLNALGESIFLDSIDQNGHQIGQDQYTVAVPEPFTMGIGLAGVAAYIRRRVKASKKA